MPLDNPHQVPFGDTDILMDARSIICDRDRWLQGGFRDGDRHCLVAALALASGSRSFKNPSETEHRLAKCLAKQIPLNCGFSRWVAFFSSRKGLMMFNDHRRTRHDDAIGVIDRAIMLLQSNVPVGADP
jgi:hypothetical protein